MINKIKIIPLIFFAILYSCNNQVEDIELTVTGSNKTIWNQHFENKKHEYIPSGILLVFNKGKWLQCKEGGIHNIRLQKYATHDVFIEDYTYRFKNKNKNLLLLFGNTEYIVESYSSDSITLLNQNVKILLTRYTDSIYLNNCF